MDTHNITRRCLLGGMATVSLASVTAFISPAPAQERGGTLIRLVNPEPASLALYMNPGIPTLQVVGQVYDGLVEYDFDLQPVPSLAEEWETSPDGKTITFRLRQDVVFHDGTPLTSADVAFSFMEVLKKRHPRGSITLRDLDSIDTPDDFTAVFNLSKPAPYLMSALFGTEAPILPKHLLDVDDISKAELANAPVGTGPFKFVEWRKGEFIRLDRNESYWRPGFPHLDRIVFRFIPDASTSSILMETGEADVAGYGIVPYAHIARLEALPNLRVTTLGHEMNPAIVELTLNTKVAPFDDQRVRQAISYAINRQQIIDSVWFGYGKVATGFISSTFEKTGLYTSDVFRYDVADALDKANMLLDEAGLTRDGAGRRIEITLDTVPIGEQYQQMAQVVKQQLAEVGIEVTLRREDWATWLKRIYTDYDFHMTSMFYSNNPDPVIGAHRTISSKSISPGVPFANGSRWSSERTDELLDLATVETNPVKRAEYYHEVQRIVAEAAPAVWISELVYPTPINVKVHDVMASPLGVSAPMYRAWKEQ